jgi:hypothetical protein
MSANPLQGETVGETAYRRIRSDIVFGRLAPGEKLKLDRVRGIDCCRRAARVRSVARFRRGFP